VQGHAVGASPRPVAEHSWPVRWPRYPQLSGDLVQAAELISPLGSSRSEHRADGALQSFLAAASIADRGGSLCAFDDLLVLDHTIASRRP